MTVSVYDAFLGGLTLRQCTAADFTPNGSAVIARLSGGLDPQLVAGGQATPRASFTTFDLYNMLNSLSITAGLAVAAGTIVLPFQQRAQGATFGGDGTNQSLSAANALIVPTGITASQSADIAGGTIDVHFRSADGLTEPVTVNTAQNLSASSFQAAYKMGPVKAELAAEGSASQIEGIQSWTVNPGLNVSVTARDGGIYPTLIVIDRRDPTVDLTFDDFDNLSRFLATYTKCVSLVCYARKLADGGTFVADATSGHISLTLTGGIGVLQTIGARENADGSVTVRFSGKTLASSVAAAIAL